MKDSYDHAVSPVVGVMLMLVVTIIIATVVSGFAGGLIGKGSGTAPTLAMDVNVINTGSYVGSGFFATVSGVSEPIATKDLKIVTSWAAANGITPIVGGNTTVPGNPNIQVLFNPADNNATYIAPFGMGLGVNTSRGVSSGVEGRTFSSTRQYFGNYSLVAGTTLSAPSCGAQSADSQSTPAAEGYGIGGRFQYSYGATGKIDAATAILGSHWEKLRAGDKVNVKVIHVPTGKVIFDKTVPVREG